MNRKYKLYSRDISDDHVVGNACERDQSWFIPVVLVHFCV